MREWCEKGFMQEKEGALWKEEPAVHMGRATRIRLLSNPNESQDPPLHCAELHYPCMIFLLALISNALHPLLGYRLSDLHIFERGDPKEEILLPIKQEEEERHHF